jgi:hypothetical protein
MSGVNEEIGGSCSPPPHHKQEGRLSTAPHSLPPSMPRTQRITMDPIGFDMTSSSVQGAADVSNFVLPSKEVARRLVIPTKITIDASHWHRVIQTIHRNPTILTPTVFMRTLQREPPLTVIQEMLRLAPQVARLPPSGPTALQVALEAGAAVGVVRAVVAACPFALCVTRSFDAIDPLLYASK